MTDLHHQKSKDGQNEKALVLVVKAGSRITPRALAGWRGSTSWGYPTGGPDGTLVPNDIDAALPRVERRQSPVNMKWVRSGEVLRLKYRGFRDQLLLRV